MKESSSSTTKQSISVIGSGVIGCTTALELARKGHKIQLIDPKINQCSSNSSQRTGTTASLGILMGYVYRRRNGRGWNLRQRSMQLWPNLISSLEKSKNELKIIKPLVQLASNEKDLERIEELVRSQNKHGLELIPKGFWNEDWPELKFGGVISHNDGRINPVILISCLLKELEKYQITKINSSVAQIEHGGHTTDERWKIHLTNGEIINQHTIIICSALNSKHLLKPLGHDIGLEPVLGQAIRLELKNEYHHKLPPIISNEGFNIIKTGDKEIIVGSTLELGIKPNKLEVEKLHTMNGNAPKWIKESTIKNRWYGIRCKPINKPAPLIESFEPGLILSSGHYRNGILLAPACAEIVGKLIQKDNQS